MNNKFCADCGKEIAKTAEICPHCGVRQIYKKSRSLKILLIWLGVVATIGVVTTMVIFGTFFSISGEEKTKMVPLDAQHRQSYEIANQTGKQEADKSCIDCHNEEGGIRFPAKHPVRPADGPMRCLFCHKLRKA